MGLRITAWRDRDRILGHKALTTPSFVQSLLAEQELELNQSSRIVSNNHGTVATPLSVQACSHDVLNLLNLLNLRVPRKNHVRGWH